MAFIALRSFDNYIEANIVMQMLQHHDINCHLKDENIITIDPLLSPAIGGMKLMVHKAQAGRAWELMESAGKEYLKTIACPQCGKPSLKVQYIKETPKTGLSALAHVLLKGYAAGSKKIYQCENCKKQFDALPAANE